MIYDKKHITSTKSLFLLISFTVFTLCSCNISKDKTNNASHHLSKTKKPMSNDNPSIDGKWILTNIIEVSKKEIKANKNPAFLIIKGQDIRGFNSCFNIQTSWKEIEGKEMFKVAPIAQVKMACSFNTFNQEFNKALINSTTYLIMDNHLVLFNNTGQESMKFIAEK